MSLLARLAFLFVVVPIVELMLLIRLGGVVGLWPTLGLVLATGMAGAVLARAEGVRVLVQVQRELMAGRVPGQALLDGLCVLVGGAFLLTPGILTDLTGFALLFPPTRRWIQGRMRRRLEAGVATGAVRFVSFGPGGAAWGGGGLGGAPWGPHHPGTDHPKADLPHADPRQPRLDPRHEIRVDRPGD